MCAVALVGVGACAETVFESDPPGIVVRRADGVRQSEGVHNVHEVAPGVWSGSAPHGAEGFDWLSDLGVRTLISVDGARPDVEAASARGMRYVHVPIQYAGLDAGERLALASALRDLPRPAYVHCHHGKHRGPAAVAAGLVMLGELDPDEGTAFLESAGTSPSYPGLWRCVREAAPVDPETLPDASALPAVQDVSGMVAAMAEADRAWDHLEACRAAGWSAPADHPDLTPAAEAGMLREALRGLAGHEDAAGYPDDFQVWLRDAVAASDRLESALVEARFEDASRWADALDASCTACHRAYRNR